jgi:hypothetical protein
MIPSNGTNVVENIGYAISIPCISWCWPQRLDSSKCTTLYCFWSHDSREITHVLRLGSEEKRAKPKFRRKPDCMPDEVADFQSQIITDVMERPAGLY